MSFIDIQGIDNKAKVAELRTIKFWKIVDGDVEEISSLISACEHYGFFYLDLTGKGSGKMLEDLERLRALMKDWFNQPQDVKMETETLSNAHG